MTTEQALTESIDRANEAIATLESTGAFRHEGLTLEQWLEARDSYCEQILDTEGTAMAEAIESMYKQIEQEWGQA